ncbi:substrate-binding domain-containing protein [Microbacterium radiodurans]|uniref:Transcriptional regulator n=1 Tax=Microbacterium radiodurans TaxID=661398 RepID=A0A5J5IWS5_9MICO|nr:substrate-binding domain-containing protein [Microbacterium radiodurans]KAA9089030.1 transcriptional regulator [Microbacterium radiodurans]
MTPGASRGRAQRGGPARGGGGSRRGAKQSAPKQKIVFDARPAPSEEPAGPFRLGAIPGATPGKWIDIWKDRMPRTPLELVHLDVVVQRAAIVDGDVDAAIVRLPLDRTGLSVIALYDEVTVAVCSADSALTAADELTLDDLAGEVRIVPLDDVVRTEVPGTTAPAFEPLETTADAVATVAAGTGVVLMPLSLARLHHRKDAEYRPVVDAPGTSVALAWRTDATTELVETFIGIVRGRTANSSR